MILQCILLILTTIINVHANQCSLEKPLSKDISSHELTTLIRNYVYPKCYDFTDYNELCKQVEDAMPRLRELHESGQYMSFLDSPNFKLPHWGVRECFTLAHNPHQCQPKYEDFENFLKHKKHNPKGKESKLNDEWTMLRRTNDPNYVPEDDCECKKKRAEKKKKRDAEVVKQGSGVGGNGNRTEEIIQTQKSISNSTAMQKFQEFRDKILSLMGKELKLMQLILESKDKRHDKLKEFTEILGHYQDGLVNFKSLIDLGFEVKDEIKKGLRSYLMGG